jgi:hypothetical protein
VHSNIADHRQQHLVRVAIHWHFCVTPDALEKDRPMTEEATPPLLSEKLIAQLQGAVDAAQRKQLPQPNDASASRSAEKEV